MNAILTEIFQEVFHFIPMPKGKYTPEGPQEGPLDVFILICRGDIFLESVALASFPFLPYTHG